METRQETTERAYYDHTGPEPAAARIRELRREGDKLAVLLDRTIFYPEGGGQPGDRGTINGVPLLDVQERDGEIFHFTAGDAPLAEGPAELRLDSRRRRDFTAAHTAQHLLSGTMFHLTGFLTVSMRLGDEICTIDVDVPVLPAETLLTVEEAVADAIEENRPVVIHLCPPERVSDFSLRKVPPQGEEVIRVVEVEGYDIVPCCGTHLASTGAIGMLRILGVEKHKGMSRVSFIAGRRVLRDSRMLRENADIASRVLKVPAAETGRGVQALMERTCQLERDLKNLEEAAARTRAEEMLRRAGLYPGDGEAQDGTLYAESFGDAGIDEVLRIGRAAQKMSGAVLVLTSERDMKFAAFCSEKKADVRPLVQKAMEVRGGKGGGGPGFFQGAFNSAEDLRAFFEDLPRNVSGIPAKR
ncbi:MAG: alanyl-tRNA editing protein [Treponema sp.]|jgi:alanyl-tRNA synthetase|nr:alanyl-tRNA editing protein [Treponema sp.]